MNSDRPILVMYQSDGWKGDVSSTTVDKTLKIPHVRRNGKLRIEFYRLRSILITRAAKGRQRQFIKVSPSVGLSKGCAAWNICTAACDFRPMSRTLGEKEITVTVYIFDGALKSDLERDRVARHSLYYDGCRTTWK